ncbi:unnamed protein product [Pylaiella littoralis]
MHFCFIFIFMWAGTSVLLLRPAAALQSNPNPNKPIQAQTNGRATHARRRWLSGRQLPGLPRPIHRVRGSGLLVEGQRERPLSSVCVRDCQPSWRALLPPCRGTARP